MLVGELRLLLDQCDGDDVVRVLDYGEGLELDVTEVDPGDCDGPVLIVVAGPERPVETNYPQPERSE